MMVCFLMLYIMLPDSLSEDPFNVSSFALASELFSPGLSLANVHAKYRKAMDQLQDEKQYREKLEGYICEMAEDFNKHIPNIKKIQQQRDDASTENLNLRRCLDNAINHQNLLKKDLDIKDRESTYLKSELSSVNNQNALLKKQVQKLLFVQFSEDPSPHELEKDAHLFSNIVELQERNLDLTNQLDELNEMYEKSLERNGEMKAELEAVTRERDELRESITDAQDVFNTSEVIRKTQEEYVNKQKKINAGLNGVKKQIIQRVEDLDSVIQNQAAELQNQFHVCFSHRFMLLFNSLFFQHFNRKVDGLSNEIVID